MLSTDREEGLPWRGGEERGGGLGREAMRKERNSNTRKGVVMVGNVAWNSRSGNPQTSKQTKMTK